VIEPRALETPSTSKRIVAGKYRLEQLLGSGSTGQVYRTTRLDTGEPAAIKLLHPRFVDDEQAILRFRREARTAATIQHPNWVTGLEFGRDEDGTWFFAMELLNGRVLSEVLREESPLPFPRIRHLILQVLDALEAAHARGLVHRDLKPPNVIIVEGADGQELAKVCDFGLTKLTSELHDDGSDTLRAHVTNDGTICGTPAYMAPEQARGLAVDARADLYAATVVLFEMVTGQVPFAGRTSMDVLACQLNATPPRLSALRGELPPGLEEAVQRGLAKVPENRFGSAAELRTALEVIFAGRWTPSSETVELPASRVSGEMADGAPLPKTGTASPVPRRRWLVVAGSVALAASLGMASLRWGHRGTDGGVELGPGARAPASSLIAGPEIAGPEIANVAPFTSQRPTIEPLPSAEELASTRGADRVQEPRRRHAARSSVAVAPVASSEELSARPVPEMSSAPAPSTVPATTASLLQDAERLVAEGRAREGCSAGERARQAAPASPAVLRFLGRCYMRTGRRSEALASYRRYLELAPTAPDAALVRSILE
jgi:serine/threonine protein kinase